ncbi:MAG: ABC transporter substrate-binding protein, partial [Dehalococcoidales bacterium]|nr:ABC transporter substrate-binding protein [Dehalococcoidales bacterium]
SVLKEYGPFILKEAIGIYLPMAQKYIMWWPWLQNYQGETVMGYSMAEYHARYIWIDADLKASMSK